MRQAPRSAGGHRAAGPGRRYVRPHDAVRTDGASDCPHRLDVPRRLRRIRRGSRARLHRLFRVPLQPRALLRMTRPAASGQAKPYLVVRASIEPSVMEEFVRWYEKEHLPHVMEIPGIVRAYRSN